MDNVNPYDYFKNDIWIPLPERSSINKYTENIGALYASFSTKFRNNTSLLVGLRGEYTYAVPATNSQYVSERQKYFDLFPNANLSIPLNKKQSQMIILGYGRKIGRPSFWQLSPFRQQLSDYMFMEGNPKLKPSYTNDYTLTWVLFRKYTLTLGAQEVKDAFSIIVDTDPSDSNIQIARQSNMPKRMNYNASLSIPAQITKWWMLNANLNGSRKREHADATGRTSKGDYLYFPRKHEQHLHLQEKLQFHDRGILHEPVTGRKRPGGGLPHGQCRPERQLL